MIILPLCLLCITLTTSLPKQFPIIGIYTQSDTSDQPPPQTTPTPKTTRLQTSNYTYIPASYVKYIQMSGAQVVPIFAYSNRDYFDELLPQINGVLFPGGDVDINITNKWTQNADYILKYAIDQKKKGNIFPIWGTCLGMQLLAYLTSGYDSKAIAPVNGELAIKNTVQINPQSHFLRDLPSELNYRLQNGQGIVYFNHHYAVTTNYYRANGLLREFWRVVATTTTLYSEQFLSFFEAYDYPFYGVQFHPEKNLYEWKVSADRSSSGAEITQILSNRFVDQARKSKNRFNSNELFVKRSIYNYQPTVPKNSSLTQRYLFNEVNSASLQQSPKLLRLEQ